MLCVFATPLIAKRGKHLLNRRAPNIPVGTVDDVMEMLSAERIIAHAENMTRGSALHNFLQSCG